MTAVLFQPLVLRGVTLPNRLALSPMCQYLAQDGMPTDWHLAHLARFALGGFGLVILESTAVTRQGCITDGDLGIWSDDHIAPLARIAGMLKSLGSVPGIQLGHAGRKASSMRPWQGGGPLDADADIAPWPTVGPCAEPAAPGWPVPEALTQGALDQLREDWVAAARRADQAGFDLIEVHAAHGYLLHSFLSPLSNQRTDHYGGDLQGRMRWPLEVITAIRAVWPAEKPVSVRISAVDGREGGWSLDDSVAFARALKGIGIDLVDCSTGGITSNSAVQRLPRGFGFQIPYAARVRAEAGIGSIAVGLILDPAMADAAVADGSADLIAIGRQALIDPNWPRTARRVLNGGTTDYADWPPEAGWWLDVRDRFLARIAAPG